MPTTASEGMAVQDFDNLQNLLYTGSWWEREGGREEGREGERREEREGSEREGGREGGGGGDGGRRPLV